MGVLPAHLQMPPDRDFSGRCCLLLCAHPDPGGGGAGWASLGHRGTKSGPPSHQAHDVLSWGQAERGQLGAGGKEGVETEFQDTAARHLETRNFCLFCCFN